MVNAFSPYRAPPGSLKCALTKEAAGKISFKTEARNSVGARRGHAPTLQFLQQKKAVRNLPHRLGKVCAYTPNRTQIRM